MPWTNGDVDSHYKGLSSNLKKLWVSVANAALKDGDKEDVAIKKANAAVNKAKKSEAFVESRDVLVEVGRMISTKNMETITSSLTTLENAIEQLKKLINADESKVSEVWSVEEAGKVLAQDESFDSIRCAVQAALRLRAQTAALAKKLASNTGIDEYYDSYYTGYPYIRDLYADYVVYTISGELYQSSYTMDTDNVVTLGDEVEVKLSYVPISSDTNNQEHKVPYNLISEPNLGTVIKLQEKAVNGDGVAQIKLISPGWGSSGYYSEKVLQRDGPKVFKKGLHMYINHPTDAEDEARPERDLKDLAGVLEEDAKYMKNGPTGPGLYAPAKVLSQYRDFIDEAAPFIGTSIRASGKASEGQAEGRYGMIIEGLIEGVSVDYVTLPGRGGQVLPLLEAARTKDKSRRDLIESNHNSNKEDLEMDEEKVKLLIEEALKDTRAENATLKTQLAESNTNVMRMKEAMILRDARDIVSSTVSSINIPDMTRARLVESCSKNPPISEDGSLDKDKLVEAVKAAALEEMNYLNSVASVSGGRPMGVGATAAKEITAEDADKALTEAFKTLGFSDAGVKFAVNGRG